jgi:heme oxygenase (biliverdin-IX-beta and delta-forming)
MFSEDLKKKTAAAHQDLEKKLIPHLRKIGSKLDYIRLLEYLYRYYEPLERQIEPYVPAHQALFHSQSILKDIEQLNPGYDQGFSEQAPVPVIRSAAAALGVQYVIEGSTLGGQIITKMLAKQLNTGTDTGFNYYNPYGNETGEKWSRFRDQLNQPRSQAENDEIVSAANETFLFLNRWISDYGSKND